MGICTVSCHFLLLLCMNIFSAVCILFTQGVFIYFKYPTFALGGFVGPFMGKLWKIINLSESDIQTFKSLRINQTTFILKLNNL